MNKARKCASGVSAPRVLMLKRCAFAVAGRCVFVIPALNSASTFGALGVSAAFF